MVVAHFGSVPTSAQPTAAPHGSVAALLSCCWAGLAWGLPLSEVQGYVLGEVMYLSRPWPGRPSPCSNNVTNVHRLIADVRTFGKSLGP